MVAVVEAVAVAAVVMAVVAAVAVVTPYTHTYLHITPYTSIYLQISNIRNMRANMRTKNGHISSPRGFPKVRIKMVARMSPKGLVHTKGGQIYLFYEF